MSKIPAWTMSSGCAASTELNSVGVLFPEVGDYVQGIDNYAQFARLLQQKASLWPPVVMGRPLYFTRVVSSLQSPA